MTSPRLAALAAAALVVTGLALAPPTPPDAKAAPAGTVHLPDLTTVIPTGSFSIVNGAEGREFRYTHQVVNEGDGPLQIRPFYRESAGDYLGRQELTSHRGSGSNDADWYVTSTRPIADAFVYHAEHGHFHFPLASFGLFRVAANGGPGALVTMSPKVGYCIADSYIADQSLEHSGYGHWLWGNCVDPTTMRGLSVGGADEYDYRDPGQSVPIDGVPDGTYWFRAISDPHNDFVESDESNNEQDVKVTIANGTVTAGEVREPDTTPCTATLRGVTNGQTLEGTVPLTTTTSASAPASVGYLVDGKPAGTGAGAAPYRLAWDAGSVVDGEHWLAAQVTQPNGRVCLSPVVEVTLEADGAPTGQAPRVTFTDPEAGSTVGGRVAIAVNAADSAGVRSVRFAVDGEPIGSPITEPPYATVWDTRAVSPGAHTITATATNVNGVSTSARRNVTVVAVSPPRLVTRDVSVVDRGANTLVTRRFSTRSRGQQLVALVSYDGPAGADRQTARVAGARLRWSLVKRSSSQSGVAEIWTARARYRVHGGRVWAKPGRTGFRGMLSVFSFRNASGVGVAAAAGAPSGAPSVYVPAVQEGSRVLAAGTDGDSAATVTPVAGQSIQRSWRETVRASTFWVQALNHPTTATRLITMADTAPTGDQWNYVAVEVKAAH